jgi:hypothetical protein
LRLGATDTATGLELPDKSTRASKFLGFDAAGDPISSPGSVDGLTVSAFGQTLIDDTDAAAFMTTLGISTFIQTLLDDADAAAARTTLGLGDAATGTIGTNVQAFDADTTKNDAANTFTQNQTLDTTGAALLTLLSDQSSGDCARLAFRGHDSGAADQTYGQINVNVNDATASSEDGIIRVLTVRGGVLDNRVHIGDGLLMTGATGADKGAGTINATAVYDDNVLLTCYPFDQYLDGTISDAKWDAKVPDRKDENGNIVEVRSHDEMRKFRARIGTDSDPLDIDKFAMHWKTKRHLTAYPNEVSFDPVDGAMSTGEWLQRGVEIDEILAIHIETLNQRTKAQAAEIADLKARLTAAGL